MSEMKDVYEVVEWLSGMSDEEIGKMIRYIWEYGVDWGNDEDRKRMVEDMNVFREGWEKKLY